MTVNGPILPDALGVTMPHEHFLWDQTCYWPGEQQDIALKELAYQKVCLENLGQIYYHAFLNLDNLQQDNVPLAIEEAMHFKNVGGNAIVDVICKVEESFLSENNLTKSTMKLVDETEFKKLGNIYPMKKVA